MILMCWQASIGTRIGQGAFIMLRLGSIARPLRFVVGVQRSAPTLLRTLSTSMPRVMRSKRYNPAPRWS